ncbi:MAG: nucleotidyltransferase domain-containing protein [Verrucomicrobiota bacterium]
MNGNLLHQRVREQLARVENERDVRVLFAAESGSRAWGFESADSDYDVRFVYVHRRDWYLSVEERRDVIERPLTDELDLSGWDLRKALRLLCKSNAALLEWFKSPVVYQHDPEFTAGFNALAARFYSPRRCFTHYLHMAFGTWRDSLRDRQEVSSKKYLYAFRPLLACRWIERQRGEVPMEFQQLVDAVLPEPDLRAALKELMEKKKTANELSMEPPVELLSLFIERELARLDALSMPNDSTGDPEELNGFFRRHALP